MSWRNHSNHKEETKAVKAALKAANIPFTRVGHGKGTAWGWLEINVGYQEDWKQSIHLRTLAIMAAQQVTGRHGDHDGDILVLAQ